MVELPISFKAIKQEKLIGSLQEHSKNHGPKACNGNDITRSKIQLNLDFLNKHYFSDHHPAQGY